MTSYTYKGQRKSSRLAPAMTVVSLVLLAGCGASEEASVAKARDFLSRNDIAAATVELKAALSQYPDSAAGRFMLGKLLLEQGDAGSAVVELERATKLKYSDTEALPLLARAMTRAGQAKKVVERFEAVSLPDPKAQASVKASLGAAYWQLEDRRNSGEALDEAVALDPSQAEARLMRASIRLMSGDAAGAKAEASLLLKYEPNNINALQTLGLAELQLSPQNSDRALELFRKAVAVKPEFASAHSEILALLLQQRDASGAFAQFQDMRKVLPKHMLTRYWEAQFALTNGDLRRAREIVQVLLQTAPDSAQFNTLAGMIEFREGALRLAEERLAKVLNAEPSARVARRLLAQTYQRLDQTEKALSVIAPLVNEGKDSDALTIAGEIHLHAGDVKSAIEAFTKAAALDPADSRARVAKALLRVGGPDSQAGYAELSAVAAEDPTAYAALALVSAKMRARDKQGALAALELLEQKSKGKSLVPYLRGRLMESTGEKVAARAAYEQSVRIDPVYLGPALALARLDVADGALDKASAQLDSILSVDPGSATALLAKAELADRKGASVQEVLKLVDAAVRARPADVPARVWQVRVMLNHRQNEAALNAAMQAAAAIPDNPGIMLLLGDAQLAASNPRQAMATFSKLVMLQPKSVVPLLKLSDVHAVLGELDAGMKVVARALLLEPANAVAQRKYIALALASGKSDDALRVARAAQQRRPKLDYGYLFEGDIQAARRKWPEAIAAYRVAVKHATGSEAAIKLYKSLYLAGKPADAESFANEWLSSRPTDARFAVYAGESSLQRKELTAAEALFRRALLKSPRYVPALNNLAYVMVMQQKPGALEFAEQAAKLATSDPAVLDTLSLALAQEGQYKRAVETQSRALALRPDSLGLRLNLAKIQIRAGVKDEARKELDRILADPAVKAFDGRDEATRLRASI